MKLNYKLVGIDIDGTLIGAEPVVSAEILDALAAVEQTGIRVVIATGRDFKQTIDIWRQLRLPQPLMPLVLVSGALVAESDTARTLYQRRIPAALAGRFAAALNQQGRTAMAYVDPWRTGLEYYLLKAGDASFVQQKWFDRVPSQVRSVESLEGIEDPILRISSIVQDRKDGETLAEELRRQFEGQMIVSPLFVRAYDVMLVEATAANANKWTGLTYVAQSCHVRPSEIVAIGDDVNDLPMFRGAGLAVAMPQSPPHVLAAAHHVAASGLGACLRDLAAGRLAPSRS